MLLKSTTVMRAKEFISELLAITASISVVMVTSTNQCVRKDFSHIPGVYAVTMVTGTYSWKPVTVAKCTRLCRLEVCTGFNMRWTDGDVRQRGHCYLLDGTAGQQYRRDQNWTLYYQTDRPAPDICPPGFNYTDITHHCYIMVTPGGRWDAAKAWCFQNGEANLLSLQSAAEETYVIDTYSGASFIAWTSGKVEANGTMYWHEGDRQLDVTYSRTISSTNSPGPCIVLYKSSTGTFWNRIDCYAAVPYICKF